MTRRASLATLCGAGAAGVLGEAFVVEPRWLDVTRHDMRGGTDAPRAPLTLALLADLHLGTVGSFEQRVAEATRGADLVVLAGDSVDRRGRLGELERFFALLPDAAEKHAVLGNWEHWAGVDLGALRKTYARHGVRLLVNSSVAFKHAGRRVCVTGFDDATAGRPRLSALPGAAPAAGFHLALAHSPVYRDRLAALPAARQPDLLLSGHTHGGQLDLLGWRRPCHVGAAATSKAGTGARKPLATRWCGPLGCRRSTSHAALARRWCRRGWARGPSWRCCRCEDAWLKKHSAQNRPARPRRSSRRCM